MSVYVVHDKLLRAYYVYDSDDKEILAGSDDKVMYDSLEDLPEEFFGRVHSYTYNELDFSQVKDKQNA
jgi:hypothetical protein